MDEAVLRVRAMSVAYRTGARGAYGPPALDNVTFSLRRHEFVSVVGPSGCGKTSMLNAVAGLIPYTAGEITVEGEPVTGPGPDRAMVFQSAGLLPWRTVLRNTSYGLELRKVGARSERRERARAMLELVGLADYAGWYPAALSGGMRQRVNLARALVADPALLLMDEPLGALDAQTRSQMQTEILRIWSAERKSVLFVTHAIDEAVYLSDRVIVLSKGPGGTIDEIVDIPLDRPRTAATRREPEFKRLTEYVEDRIQGGQLVQPRTTAGPARPRSRVGRRR